MPPQKPRGRYEAPAAGAFGGVATLGIGQHIPDTYPLIKYVAVYGSPILSLLYTALVQSGFILTVATVKRREIEKALQRVRRIRDEAAASKMARPAHLKRLQETVENTEVLASRMATASNAAVVEMFAGISISDLMAKATSVLEEEISTIDSADATDDEMQRNSVDMETSAVEDDHIAAPQTATKPPPTVRATAAAAALAREPNNPGPAKRQSGKGRTKTTLA